MRFGLSFPRIAGGFRPWVSVDHRELDRMLSGDRRPARRVTLPWKARQELRNALQEAAKTRGEPPMSRASADALINEAMSGTPEAVQALLERCITVKLNLEVERREESEAPAPVEPAPASAPPAPAQHDVLSRSDYLVIAGAWCAAVIVALYLLLN